METITDPATGETAQVMGTVGGEPPESSPPAETPSTPGTPSQAAPTETPVQPPADTPAPPATPSEGQPQPPVAPASTPAPETPDLGTLGEIIAKQVKEGVETATKGLQSSSDRRVSVLERSMKATEERHLALQKQYRELQMDGLSDEEKVTMQARLAQEDRTGELQKWEDNLTAGNLEFNVTTLLAEHGEYVTEAELNEIDDVEKLEPFCMEKRVTFLEAKISGASTAEGASQQPPGATTAQPATAAQPQVPAGAGAASDVGSAGSAPQGVKFNEATTPEAMEQNLRNTPWETAQVPARAR